MASSDYANLKQQAKSDKSSAPAVQMVQMGRLVADTGDMPTTAITGECAVNGGWSTGIFDCSMSPSSSFFACCVPWLLWSRSLTRARVGKSFAGLIIAYLLLSLGSQFGFKKAGKELAGSFNFMYNSTTYDDFATQCAPLKWRECVADPFGPCTWMGKMGKHDDDDDEMMPGCRPRPVDIAIDHQKLHCAMGLALLAAVLGLVLVCLRACMRTRFRKRMGIRGTALGDCVAHAVVPCCAIAQEARHADAANLPRVDWRGRIVAAEVTPVVLGEALSAV